MPIVEAASPYSGGLLPIVRHGESGEVFVNLTFAACTTGSGGASAHCQEIAPNAGNPYVSWWARASNGTVYYAGHEQMNLAGYVHDLNGGVGTFAFYAEELELPAGNWSAIAYVVSYGINTGLGVSHYTVSGALNGLDLSFETPTVDTTTGDPETPLYVASDVTVATALDPYLPLLIWGGLFILFLYFSAWAPAVAAMIGLAVQLPEPDFWPLAASVMILAVSLFLHKVASDGIIPLPWRRST